MRFLGRGGGAQDSDEDMVQPNGDDDEPGEDEYSEPFDDVTDGARQV